MKNQSKERAEITSYNRNVPDLIELDERLLESVTGGACPLNACQEHCPLVLSP